MTINLREKDRRMICAVAAKSLRTPLEIWAYGSRVNGDAHESSDLDVVIRTVDLQPLDRDELLGFKEQLQESNLPILVQVQDWARMPASFRSAISKKYHVLYSNTQKNQKTKAVFKDRNKNSSK